jgi:hypothetical protein
MSSAGVGLQIPVTPIGNSGADGPEPDSNVRIRSLRGPPPPPRAALTPRLAHGGAEDPPRRVSGPEQRQHGLILTHDTWSRVIRAARAAPRAAVPPAPHPPHAPS